MFSITHTPFAKKPPVIKPFYIGKVLIPNPLVLAPMAGITDVIFRRIIKSLGAGLAVSEMVSCQGIHYKDQKTHGLLEIHPDEKPVAIQIFGSDPYKMAEAAKVAQHRGADMVDINLGCSVPKVVKTGGGAALCRDLNLLQQILSAVVKAVEIPVTIKIRKGWSSQELSAPEVCRIAEAVGISAIALHGRTSSQKYSGHADWYFIKQLREHVKIPLIGNGDITDPKTALQCLSFSGCEAVMIGRASYSNPWIFSDTLELLMKERENDDEKERKGLDRDNTPLSYPPPPVLNCTESEEQEPVGDDDDLSPPPLRPSDYPLPPPHKVKELILLQLGEMIARCGEKRGVKNMRKFIAWYSRGMYGSGQFREKVFKIQSPEELIDAVTGYFDKL